MAEQPDGEAKETPTNGELSTVADIEIRASQIVERLEEAVDKATEAVQILEESDETHPSYKEANLGLKGQTWKSSEGFLQPKEKPIPQILSLVEDLIVYEQNEDEEDGPNIATLPPLSVVSKLSFVLQTVSTFANNLERAHLNNLHNRVQNDTTRWVTHLFRCYDSNAFYHEEPFEGVVRITRMMLHYRYPKYLEDGFDALKLSPPVIYSSMASSLGVVQHICRQLGLAMSCVRPVPCNNNMLQRMDVAMLEKLVEEDKAQNRIPILVLADAGSGITGHVDNILTLHELCKNNNMWLHVRGHCLASLAMVNSNNMPKRIADSLTLSIGTWLGVAGLPTVTLYHRIEPPASGREGKTVGTARETTLPMIAGLVGDHFHKRLVALPLWFTLQALGRDGVQKRIKQSLEMGELLWKKLSKYKCLRLLGQSPGGDTGTLSIDHITNKPLTSLALMLEVVASTVVFQFVPVKDVGEDDGHVNWFQGKVAPYFDKLNSWLGQVLQRDLPQVNVETCELEHAGIVLRICPLETVAPLTEQDVDMFISYLDQQIEILSATVRLKVLFQDLVNNNPCLKFVEMDGWAGLGGVRYVPQVSEQVEITEQWEQDINRLNIDLVTKLRSTDTAFSFGEGRGGEICVRFGMVTSDTDIEELLSLVTSTGREIEESAKYLDVMVEIVKKGIETATLDLQKENEERVRQEGIIRHVPVFGSLVNWWYPKPKETGVRGRSLNLQAGVVESTENIYRYHMQMKQGITPPGTKQPPQPMVQTTLLTENSNNHSRSSSQSSTKSELHKLNVSSQLSSTDTKVNQTTATVVE